MGVERAGLAVLLATPVLFGAGCPDLPRERVCDVNFVGDAAAAPEITLLATDGVSQTQTELVDGTPVRLQPPPQGGFVFYVGVRVRNMDVCDLGLTGDLRRTDTNKSMAYATRNVALRAASGGAESDPTVITSYVHVNPCPNYEPEEILGIPHRLVLDAIDRAGRRATIARLVVPTCELADPKKQQECRCTCAAGYFAGKCL